VTADRLPATAPLGDYLRAHALHGRGAFIAALPGPAVLVRVDERGGHGELAPWAFPAPDDVPLAPGSDDDQFLDLASTSMSAEATATGPPQPPLPRPAAREQATVIVVPDGGGHLGRAAASAVRVTERSVSRHHADLVLDGDCWLLADQGSDNGTGVNGLPLRPGVQQRVRSGDVIQLGDVVLVFLDAAAFFDVAPTLAGT
jgi:hypothetical protein